MREIVLDTETTGLDPDGGDRLIELGCVELMNRIPTGREYHCYFTPEGRAVHPDAEAVHGLSGSFLATQPRFADQAVKFLEFIADAPLVIHNASFDIGFINHELERFGLQQILSTRVVDTLALARRRHPAGPNSLDALCKRYGIDNSGRELHGALLDSELLADVYLSMTGGQTTLSLAGEGADGDEEGQASAGSEIRRLPASRQPGRIVRATPDELAAHLARLEVVAKAAGGPALWQTLD